MFDLIGGTSIGGIIASSLSHPASKGSQVPKYSADDIFEFLCTQGPRMFQENWFSFGGLLRPKYSGDSADSLLLDWFGEANLSDSLIKTVLPTYDIFEKRPLIFESWNKREKYRTWDVARGTSAAPTYFPPHRIFPVNQIHPTPHVLVDGGVYLNNPTAYLTFRALDLFPKVKRIEIVSLGTGEGTNPLYNPEIFKTGLVEWAQKLPDLFMGGHSSLTEQMMTMYCDSSPETKYTRWNPPVRKEAMDMDNTEKENIDELISVAGILIKDHFAEFKDLGKRLSKARPSLEPYLKLSSDDKRENVKGGFQRIH